MLRGFCYGRSATDVAKVTSDWALKNGQKKVTRETVNRYFIALGNHLFYAYDGAREFDDDYLATLRDMVYNGYEIDDTKREELGKAGILAYINTLQKMSKINNGLSAKHFKSHLGHAIFLTVAYQEYGNDCTKRFYEAMIRKLEKAPLTL